MKLLYTIMNSTMISDIVKSCRVRGIKYRHASTLAEARMLITEEKFDIYVFGANLPERQDGIPEFALPDLCGAAAKFNPSGHIYCWSSSATAEKYCESHDIAYVSINNGKGFSTIMKRERNGNHPSPAGA